MRAITLATVLVMLGSVTPGYAEDASPEKCTCDAKRGAVQDNGAQVENATACWASVDEGREWCRITVEALQGDERHQGIIDQLMRAKDDPATLFGYLYELSQGALAVEGDKSSTEYAAARSNLPTVIKAYDEATSKCVGLFLDKADGFEEGDFSCQISDLTGWLRMSYRIGSFRFVFMIAPNA
ncbi:hypothetical protein [Sinorhizobium fredii]|uniref:hypothetical protein n=1 Tax=Rhizobium fredii TaxID=380 RepID=UPI00055EFF11|nr:hypothetical protein [Sinorhizobium fredii]ASY74392.1 hypothetical protein SF83666_d70070 [Sinorhizobium fredii CCBAU 83666]